MTDPVYRAMEEVWEWKRRAEEATRGMSRRTLIEFYHAQAREAERKFGLDLRSQPAADAARLRQQA